MTTGRINQVTTIRETLSEITLENQSSLNRERPQSRHVSFKKYCPSSSCYPWTMFLVPQTNLGLGNAQKIETLREYLFSRHPFSMARFWFLLGATRTQPPGYPHPNSHAPTSNRKDKNRSALAPELPQAPLRGEVPPGLPIKRSQQVYPQVGFEYFYS